MEIKGRKNKLKTISANEVQQKLENGEQLNIIDVREVDEYQSGHIPGSKNIPLSLFEYRVNELPKNKPYIIVCLSGGRSAQATMYLESHGYDATNMTGGMMAWFGDVE